MININLEEVESALQNMDCVDSYYSEVVHYTYFEEFETVEQVVFVVEVDVLYFLGMIQLNLKKKHKY